MESTGKIIFGIEQREFWDHIKFIMGCFKEVVEMCIISYRMFAGKGPKVSKRKNQGESEEKEFGKMGGKGIKLDVYV